MQAVAATAVQHLIAALGIGAALWASTACGGTESGVVAPEEERVVVERVETVDADSSSSRPIAQFDDADTASGGRSDAVAGEPSPTDISTGPLLQWTEFDPAIDGSGSLYSIGDGRVVILGDTSAGASKLLSTSDGSDWSVVLLPSGLSPHTFDLTGARWAVAGWPHEGPHDADFGDRIYVSDDRGASWTEVTLRIDPPDLPEHAIAHTSVSAVATSGAQVVALTSTHLNLDIEALLADRGLLPAGAQVHGISTGGGQVKVWLHEESSQADSHGEGQQRTSETALTFTVDELDLSVEQLAIMESPFSGEATRVYSGTGTELGGVLRLDGWHVGVIGNDDGFVLLTETDTNEISRLTSPDGENWTAQLLESSLLPGWVNFTALDADGTVWSVSSDGTESHLTRWGTGSVSLTTTRLGRLRSADELSVGPGGLATLAYPSRPEPPEGTGDYSALPTGRVAKDGYELRYGEPEGGISLWDVEADEPVYEFGPEIIASGELPEGVREVDDGDVFELAFDDPVTGAELVTFTLEDLEAVIGVTTDSSDWSERVPWVGWSSDGTDWGWQDAREAFGLGDVEAHVVVAVGSDFVIASVWAFPPVVGSDSGSGTANGRDVIIESEVSIAPSAESAGQRWFIARVP